MTRLMFRQEKRSSAHVAEIMRHTYVKLGPQMVKADAAEDLWVADMLIRRARAGIRRGAIG